MTNGLSWENLGEAGAQFDRDQLVFDAANDGIWNWPDAVAWVATTDAEQVAISRGWGEFWQSLPDGPTSVALAARVSSYVARFPDCERRLVAAFKSGSLTAKAKQSRWARFHDIPLEDWHGSSVTYQDTANLTPDNAINPTWYDISINRALLQALFQSAQAARATEQSDNIATLPPGSKPADRKNEPFAHEAAKLVRAGLGLAAALRQVRPHDPSRIDPSIDAGVRATFSKMYNRDGFPLR